MVKQSKIDISTSERPIEEVIDDVEPLEVLDIPSQVVTKAEVTPISQPTTRKSTRMTLPAKVEKVIAEPSTKTSRTPRPEAKAKGPSPKKLKFDDKTQP